MTTTASAPAPHTQQALYAHTTNSALALSLCLAGEPLVDLWNEYHAETLKKLGCTAREAWQRGVPGIIKYYFEPSERLNKLVAAWNDERAKLKETGTGSTLPNVNPEDVIRIVAACLDQRKAWAEMWKRVVPMLTTANPGAPVRTNDEDGTGFRIEYPGFKTVSINAPAHVKAQLEKM